MAYGIKLLICGDYASFNRPEMKVERVSYDVITPGAARGNPGGDLLETGDALGGGQVACFKPNPFHSYPAKRSRLQISTKNIASAMKTGEGQLGEFRLKTIASNVPL